ncbi:MAG TPA: lipase maturation factor family protein, partial [Vicinamibacteria bacterium]
MEGDPQGGPEPQAPGLSGVRRLFLRLLGLVYLAAFASLAVQVEGLYGSRGILPVTELLGFAASRLGPERYRLLPTLAWVSASDGALLFLAWGGAALALLQVACVAPRLVLLLLWAFYLSLVSPGRVFMGFQWDGLLLEAGLLAVFLAPGGVRPGAGAPPPPAYAVWLLRLLLFRLMFGSGAVKLLSGDPTWRSLDALRVHYETQPLPTWIGWYAHQLPVTVQRLSCGTMFLVELGLPLLIFAGRSGRLVAFAGFVLLQGTIALTGNYGFFNLLTVALAVLLLDDAALPRALRPAVPAPVPAPRPLVLWIRRAATVVPATLFLVSVVVFSSSLGLRVPWPAPVLVLEEALAPFRSVNAYGLFAVMTTSRPAILVEGSRDGLEWRAYPFRFKPDDLDRPPGFVAPHQPRLDWQMWFAALGDCEANPWFLRFLDRLREGSPPVLGLLAGNPFPEGPPRY